MTVRPVLRGALDLVIPVVATVCLMIALGLYLAGGTR